MKKLISLALILPLWGCMDEIEDLGSANGEIAANFSSLYKEFQCENNNEFIFQAPPSPALCAPVIKPQDNLELICPNGGAYSYQSISSSLLQSPVALSYSEDFLGCGFESDDISITISGNTSGEYEDFSSSNFMQGEVQISGDYQASISFYYKLSEDGQFAAITQGSYVDVLCQSPLCSTSTVRFSPTAIDESGNFVFGPGQPLIE
jgi:hypothetical protein